jgi:hypothetical protein
VVCHGQRVAVLPILSFELALEVRWPDLVRPSRLQANRAGVLPESFAAALPQLAVSFQQFVYCASGRNMPSRMLSLDDLPKLRCAPAILLSKREDLALDALRRSVRVTKWRTRAIFDGLQAFILDPVNPFVSGGPGDLVSVTQFTHRPLATRVVAIELLTLF